MQNNSPDSTDTATLNFPPIPNFMEMGISEVHEWLIAEALRCRRQMRAQEERIAGLEMRERDREGGK